MTTEMKLLRELKVPVETLKLLREYHEYHCDSVVRCVGVVNLPTGGHMYLMRFRNERGLQCSSLDMIGHRAYGAYVTEMWSCERPDEQEMLRQVLEGDEVYADD